MLFHADSVVAPAISWSLTDISVWLYPKLHSVYWKGERENKKKNCKKSRTLREVNCCDIHNKGRSSIHSVKYRLTYESDPFFPMSILFTNWTPKKWRQKRTLHSFRDGFFVTFDKRQKATALNDVFGAILRMPDYILYILTIIFHQG